MNALEAAQRWLGILSSGIIIGDEAEASLKILQRVLGAPALTELRHWFVNADPNETREARIAAVEACIAIVRADRSVGDSEREAIERIIHLSDLDDDAQAALMKHIDQDVSLDDVARRLQQPALRDALLVLAWQIARADGRVAPEEAGVFGELADRFGVTPMRANELRAKLSS